MFCFSRPRTRVSANTLRCLCTVCGMWRCLACMGWGHGDCLQQPQGKSGGWLLPASSRVAIGVGKKMGPAFHQQHTLHMLCTEEDFFFSSPKKIHLISPSKKQAILDVIAHIVKPPRSTWSQTSKTPCTPGVEDHSHLSRGLDLASRVAHTRHGHASPTIHQLRPPIVAHAGAGAVLHASPNSRRPLSAEQSIFCAVLLPGRWCKSIVWISAQDGCSRVLICFRRQLPRSLLVSMSRVWWVHGC